MKNPEKLEIIFIQNEKIITSKVFEIHKDYSIEKGWIHLKWQGELTSGDNVVGFSGGRNSLTTNEEGDLIIKSEGWGVGLILLIPVGGSGHNWIKFTRIQNYSHSLIQ